ncbi:tRNA (guanine-N(7)-)-methyltransferase non-catalytic subunit wdr4 [Artemisia annua]|uniref:tRNA (Guanine-N(7)-)-methyltransferase non-catalytic subunit wdr4 n=1 Tax=Artemisia annua TaxID=35608 RepID=A0A2U1MEI7_ARTAN|nr:tRNA (guanine-N(7)-)-methyltransferase non-catalytic subunit wdr4 [Artemisia annua]
MKLDILQSQRWLCDNMRMVKLLCRLETIRCIITSLEFSTDGKLIVTADRDFKIRVTVLPKKLLDGAHEMDSFCLGHTE